MSNFYTDVIQKDPRFRSTVPIKDMALLEPVTRIAVAAVIADAKARGIGLVVLETYRSQELQSVYFGRGVTQLRTVGVHHYGLACDLGVLKAGSDVLIDWHANYAVLGELGKDHGLVWGGNWNEPGPVHFPDEDHLQRINVKDQRGLFAGTWYPDADYSPYR